MAFKFRTAKLHVKFFRQILVDLSLPYTEKVENSVSTFTVESNPSQPAYLNLFIETFRQYRQGLRAEFKQDIKVVKSKPQPDVREIFRKNFIKELRAQGFNI